MRLAHLFVFLFGIGILTQPAIAQDEDDFLLDEDPDEDDEVVAPVNRIDEGDTPQGEGDDSSLDDEENELDTFLNEGEAPIKLDIGLDFDDDEESDEALPPGTDNAAIYRAQLDQMVGMQADEEGMAWEGYLQAYPYSVFRKQIEARMDELSEAMFRGPRGAVAEVKTGKPKRQELDFTAGMLIEPIDPRTRLRGGFEWGYPSWINLIIQYEHQLQRDLSLHAGMSHRYTGWTLAAGTRYAIVQSSRTDFILTAIGDLQMNLDPVAPGVRPMLAAGKRVQLKGEGFVDVQAQTGSDLMFYPGMFSPRWLSGLNITVSPSKRVQAFVEITAAMKDMGSWNEKTGAFKFNQFAFGLRFQGKGKGIVGAAATVPFTTNYWRHHFGAVMADYQYYM